MYWNGMEWHVMYVMYAMYAMYVTYVMLMYY